MLYRQEYNSNKEVLKYVTEEEIVKKLIHNMFSNIPLKELRKLFKIKIINPNNPISNMEELETIHTEGCNREDEWVFYLNSLFFLKMHSQIQISVSIDI